MLLFVCTRWTSKCTSFVRPYIRSRSATPPEHDQEGFPSVWRGIPPRGVSSRERYQAEGTKEMRNGHVIKVGRSNKRRTEINATHFLKCVGERKHPDAQRAQPNATWYIGWPRVGGKWWIVIDRQCMSALLVPRQLFLCALLLSYFREEGCHGGSEAGTGVGCEMCVSDGGRRPYRYTSQVHRRNQRQLDIPA